jgi:hypothetical protein
MATGKTSRNSNQQNLILQIPVAAQYSLFGKMIISQNIQVLLKFGTLIV